MKTNFRKSELIVIMGIVLAWALIVNVFFMIFDLNVQAILYTLMSLLMPVGFLAWALVKKDYVFSGIFGFWSAFYVVTLVGVGDWFLTAMKLLPILGSIALIVVAFLRWAQNKEEAKIKAENAEETQEIEKAPEEMSNKEIVRSIWTLIQKEKSVRILFILFCTLLIVALGVIALLFSLTL